jgi:hypothetical protein
MKKSIPPLDTDAIVTGLCAMDENIAYESKRVSNKMVHKALETIVAFSNTESS